MNRRPSGLSVSKALVGFLNTKAAEGLSPRTLQNYEHRLKQWIGYAGEVDVTRVSTQDIRRYMSGSAPITDPGDTTAIAARFHPRRFAMST